MTGQQGQGITVTVTSTTLLDGLLDPENRTVWSQYVDRYRPLVVRFCRRLGLDVHDAEDVAQTTLLDFSQAYAAGKYDRERGRLRDWLLGLVQNRIKNHRRRRPEREIQPALDTQGEGPLEVVISREEMEDVWEAEWRSAVLRLCMREIEREFEASTYRAFELFSVQELPAEEVARRLEMTPNAVYGAKRRVVERLRELRPRLEEDF